MKYRLPALVLVALVPAFAARAAGDGLIDTFGAWSAFASGKGKERVCYMGAVPEKSDGDYTKRGDTYVWVSHQPGAGQTDVVEVRAGYGYKPGSDVAVTIGGESFALFTQDDSAWARDAKTDAALVAAMKRGNQMVIKGVSSRGTETLDTYSLSGVTAAHQAIGKACGVK